jgi:hypothetical protein
MKNADFKNVGRNEPCPCGSGKKFKKCHLPLRSAVPDQKNANEPRLVKIGGDFEVDTRLISQCMALLPRNSGPGHWSGYFMDVAFQTAAKVRATKYHAENVKRIEQAEVQRILRDHAKPSFVLQEAWPLAFETEAFLFQVKSSLDMAVKALDQVGGKGIIGTETFGNKGEKVIKGLEQWKKKGGINIEAIDGLINLIKQDKEEWLEKAVAARDQISHFQAMQNVVFEPVKNEAGKMGVRPPKLAGMPFSVALEILFRNNMEFLQDFLSQCVLIGLGQGFHLIPANADHSKRFVSNDTCIPYVKWGVGIHGTLS